MGLWCRRRPTSRMCPHVVDAERCHVRTTKRWGWTWVWVGMPFLMRLIRLFMNWTNGNVRSFRSRNRSVKVSCERKNNGSRSDVANTLCGRLLVLRPFRTRRHRQIPPLRTVGIRTSKGACRRCMLVYKHGSIVRTCSSTCTAEDTWPRVSTRRSTHG